MIIPKKLQSFDYYRSKLPLYLQNSEGFEEHFKIWYDFLVGSYDEITESRTDNNGVIGSLEEVLRAINVFSDDFPIENSDMLDKLGSIFGLSRYVNLTYSDSEGLHENESIVLSNDEFLLLIKAQIIKDYFDGSYVQAKEYYENANLFIVTKNDTSPASLLVYLNNIPDSQYSYSENVQKLFLAGKLNIKSMGIKYNYAIQDLNSVLIWKNTDGADVHGWDGGQWAI